MSKKKKRPRQKKQHTAGWKGIRITCSGKQEKAKCKLEMKTCWDLCTNTSEYTSKVETIRKRFTPQWGGDRKSIKRKTSAQSATLAVKKKSLRDGPNSAVLRRMMCTALVASALRLGGLLPSTVSMSLCTSRDVYGLLQLIGFGGVTDQNIVPLLVVRSLQLVGLSKGTVNELGSGAWTWGWRLLGQHAKCEVGLKCPNVKLVSSVLIAMLPLARWYVSFLLGPSWVILINYQTLQGILCEKRKATDENKSHDGKSDQRAATYKTWLREFSFDWGLEYSPAWPGAPPKIELPNYASPIVAGELLDLFVALVLRFRKCVFQKDPPRRSLSLRPGALTLYDSESFWATRINQFTWQLDLGSLSNWSLILRHYNRPANARKGWAAGRDLSWQGPLSGDPEVFEACALQRGDVDWHVRCLQNSDLRCAAARLNPDSGSILDLPPNHVEFLVNVMAGVSLLADGMAHKAIGKVVVNRVGQLALGDASQFEEHACKLLREAGTEIRWPFPRALKFKTDAAVCFL